MKAAWYETQGAAADVLAVGERADPVAGPGEVLVAMHASGVNPSDVKIRAGARGPMAVDCQIPHSDGAGEIIAVGEGVDGDRIGERVWIFNAAFQREGGSCAELCALPESQAVPLPGGVSFETGAAIGIPYITAHAAVFAAGLVSGKTVLVTGGAGSVGLAAIQFAKWGGARVIATVSGPAKARAAEAAGADLVLNYRDTDVAAAVLDETDGAGADVIVEVEFGGNLATSAAALAMGGVIAAYGSEAAREPALPFYELMFRNARIQTLFAYRFSDDQIRSAKVDITAALADGALEPRIWKTFELDKVAAAHETVEAGEKIGAVVVTLR